MDEEDSQDELINKNASHGKGKRPATSILSDEEENSCDDSQEGATDSEEEDDEDASVDGEDEDVEEEDDEEEEAEKDLEGAVGSTSTDLAGLSSDEDAEKCPICLNSFHEQPVATPESCEHYFCLDCILEWAKSANSCPVDRIVFSNILLRKCFGGKVQKTITVQKSIKAEEQVDLDLEQTSCEVCGGSDREDRLLLCDGCDAGYHMECLTPPLDAVPVEEWFCPECAANNVTTSRSEQSSEEERVLPTTSQSRPGSSRPLRAIARTQHSERVRASVNRHRITQARTAAQIAPRYLMQSTWLDETINAVVAGLNTAVYVRDLTPRPRSSRRRRTVKRRKTKKEGKAAGGKTSTTKVKRRKRKGRRRSRKKVVVKKETTARSRIARNLGMKKPSRSSVIPSVYRPSEQTLGSMRADIGAASLSIYGDPFDLDPVDDEEEEMQQASTPSSLLEAKRRGLSRSALRSHQPVARPILAGLSSRRGHGIPQIEEVAEAAPVPDLLGSILSGQSMLLMDSSDVVINRDGSLKAAKPASSSLPRSRISSGSTSGETGRISSTGASPFQSSRQPTLSSSSPSSHSSLDSCPTPLTPVSPSPLTSHTPLSIPERSQFHTPLPHRPMPSHSAETEQLGTCGVRGKPSVKVTSGSSDSHVGDKGGTPKQLPAKKPPPKPVWVDVSGLPRIPKIKRESNSTAHGSSGSSSNYLPESSMTSLAGDKSRQHTVDQQGGNTSRQNWTVDSQRQRLDRTGSSSSFSNSFSAPSSSASLSSNSRPSSSSISFRINASGNPWHARRLSAQEPILPPKKEDSTKRMQKDKQMLLLSRSQGKKASVKSEVYDPFDPTGSDSSESEAEEDYPKTDAQSTVSMLPTLGQNENTKNPIKTEPMELEPTVTQESSSVCVRVKKEPVSCEDEPWTLPSHQLGAGHTQMLSGSLAAVMAYSGSPAISDAECSGSSESPFPLALDRSRSSSTSSHHSDKVKIEVKAEPDIEPAVKPKSNTEKSKGNRFDKVSSVTSSSDRSHKSKEKEISPCTQPQEEGRESGSASQSPPLKNFDHFDKAEKDSQSEERRHSHSRSPIHRRSRSKSTERRLSRSRSKEKRLTCSSSVENKPSLSSSKEKRRSRSRSKEKRRSRSRSKEKRRSRSRSKDKRRSRSRSNEKRRSRSRSKEKRRSRSRSKEKRRSRSRSKEKRRSRSRSREKKRSRSRSKEKRRSRSRSKEKRRSRSRSKEKRRSRSRSKEKRRSRSRSKEKRRSRSRSKEKRRSRSRSKEKRRSRSRSKEKRRSRSRSKERRYSYSRDRRRSTRSSSSESPKKKKTKRENHERYDGTGKDGHKRYKEKKRSRSRSRSRSRERKREQPSSRSSNTAIRDRGETRSKRSRSTSRDRKRRGLADGSHQKERSINTYNFIETKEPKHKSNKIELPLKDDTKSRGKENHTRISDVSIKKESEPSSPLYLIEESKKIKEEYPLVSDASKQYNAKPNEIKQESIWPHEKISKAQLQKDIKQEMDQSSILCEDLKPVAVIKEEAITTLPIIKTSQEFSEVSFSETSTHRQQASCSVPQNEKRSDDISEPAKPIEIEQIWPDDDDDNDNGDDSYGDSALVINLCSPSDPVHVECEKETHVESLHKEEMEVEPLQAPCPVKQEPVDSSDEDINVDYLIDNLDFIKKEMKESSVTDPAGDVEPQTVTHEDSAGTKQEIEPALVTAGTKTKSQGKRVTWNIQEPEGPQPEKISKLALFKLKLKQEGSRKAASTYATQSFCAEGASAQVGPNPAATSLNPAASEDYSNSEQGGSKSTREELIQDFHQKDKYMKKLHMQERAIEEVKLAIKPFYQKRDITKEEYKEILRKAVQKVCHSKSGEINPVKVANLVKAYVDKYKHARKHRKDESLPQSAEGTKDSETPG